MSEAASTPTGTAPSHSPSWNVRAATSADVPAAAHAVGELLEELGGRRPSPRELEEEARALVEDPGVGALLVAEAGGEVVGVLAAIDAVAREQGLARIEVGLPQESFVGIRATEAFYLGNGFASLGIRMRRLL